MIWNVIRVDRVLRHGIPLLIAALVLAGAASLAAAEVLLHYDMKQATPSVENPAEALAGRALRPGAGVGNFNLPSGLGYSTTPVCVLAPASGVLPLGNAATALAADCVLSFEFQVAWSVRQASLESLAFDIARGGLNTNRGFGVYITTPTVADVEVRGSTYVTAQRYSWEPQVIGLAGFPELQELRAGDVVRIKIAFWTADPGQTLELDNLTLSGTIQPSVAAREFRPLRITSIEPGTNLFKLSWLSNTGRVYTADFSPDLITWAELPVRVPAGAIHSTTALLDLGYNDLGSNTLLLHYRMGQAGPQVQGDSNSVIGGPLSPGTGLLSFNLSFGEYPSSSPALFINFLGIGADLAGAIARDNVFRFEVTAGANVTSVALTSLSFSAARGGSSTPRGYGILVSTPTKVNETAQPATTIDTVRPTWQSHTVDLSAMASLHELKPGQRVTFTIAAFSPASNNSLEFDDLMVRGTVTPRTLPKDSAGRQLFFRLRELEGEPILIAAATRPTNATWNLYPTRTVEQLPTAAQAAQDGALSQYGGWLAFRTNATGFFYPLKIRDRWWLVDPEGYLFLHQGVAVVSTINSPGAAAALSANFGSAANWAVATSSLLRRQRFNGAGAWSDTSRLRTAPGPLVRTIIANFLGSFSATNSSPGYPQVFEPAFETFCLAYAQRFAATRNEPGLLGYFSDNELPFPVTTLNTWLGLAPGNSSYNEAWRWLRQRYGPNAAPGNVTSQDQFDFLGHVWARYYRLVNQAIKAHDPDHLYLGSRLYSSDKDRPEIFRAIGPHVDVVSVNHYSQWTPDINRIRMWERESGRPVIITEFYVKGEDSGMPNNTGAGWVVRTQKDRGAFYQNFALALLDSRVCVGWHWFKYADNDPDSNPDPSNIDSNKGVVSNRYMPHSDLLDAMRLLNERVYSLTQFFDGATAREP